MCNARSITTGRKHSLLANAGTKVGIIIIMQFTYMFMSNKYTMISIPSILHLVNTRATSVIKRLIRKKSFLVCSFLSFIMMYIMSNARIVTTGVPRSNIDNLDMETNSDNLH